MSLALAAPTRSGRRVIGIAAGLFAVVAPSAVADGEESFFTSPSGEFTIVFPDRPQDLSGMMPSGSAVGDFEAFATFTDDSMYLAGRVESSFPVDAADAHDLDALVDQFVSGLGGGDVTHSSLIEHRGMSGFEIAAATDTSGSPAYLYGRFYFTSTVGYMAFVMGERPSISMKDADVAAFLGSFDFVKEAF